MMKAWGRLLRLSLAPSALADVAAGAVFAQGGFHPAGRELWTMLAASACVYHGGMALNDWSDREHDARTRPDRPIPSGAISARAALVVAALLLVLGVALAWSVGPSTGAWTSVAAAGAIAYDLVGRGPVLGPALLALCRAANLGSGIALGLLHGTSHVGAPVEVQYAHLVPLVFYAAYVFGVSRVGRMEDAEDDAPIEPAPWILLALVALVALPWSPPPGLALSAAQLDFDSNGHLLPVVVLRWSAGLLALAAAYAPLRLVARTRTWTRPLVLRAMGLLLRRLLVLTGSLALATCTLDGALVAAAILAGYPLSFALRKVFPPS
ncbi:MAG: UbiA family prenyltransferase [Planctomycetes bacterium]|nr:UbiA family prenyltransferase [Planctomycetota bacterium]